MSAPIVSCVYALRIAMVRSTEKFGKTLLFLRNSDQVNMIGHQAVGQDIDLCDDLQFFNQLNV